MLVQRSTQLVTDRDRTLVRMPSPARLAPASRPRRAALAALLAAAATVGSGCAHLGAPPLNVSLVGVEPLPGEGMELRLLVKLRVQNPGQSDVSFDGVSLDLDMRGQRLASGVLAQAGTLPRFGETLLAVPVSVSGLAVLREAVALLRQGGETRSIEFTARGRLGGGFGGRSFATRAEIDWPPRPPGASGTAPAPRP